LNVELPTHTPRATEFINDMIGMVQELIASGHAYTTDYAVYFDVTTYHEYTKLSGQQLAGQEQGEGHGSVTDSNKRNAADFALWFFKAGTHAHALQTWPSPFVSPLIKHGEGFPGWHIECSAMSKHYLGTTFDVHMGGIEHIPIHHTNEIAQSTCANHEHFVNYWLHNEHLLVDNKKMAKSEGTSFTIADIEEKGFEPLTLRYFFLQAHYRSKQNFTWEGLTASQTAYRKLRTTIQNFPDDGTIADAYQILFHEMINDDLNTAGALATVWELLKNPNVSDADKKATILDFDKVLGLELDKVIKETTVEIPDHVQKLINERITARANKDWRTSDRLRDEIQALGFKVEDR
jgi:cysteinyl-tRNA synthetase